MGPAVGADLRYGGVYHSICANAKNSGLIRDGIVYAVSMDGKSKADAVADISNALTVPDKQSKVTVAVYAVDLYNGEVSDTFATLGANSCVSANHAGPAVCFLKSDSPNNNGTKTKIEPQIVVYDARGNGRGGVSPTLTGDHQNRITDYTAVVVEKCNEANA